VKSRREEEGEERRRKERDRKDRKKIELVLLMIGNLVKKMLIQKKNGIISR